MTAKKKAQENGAVDVHTKAMLVNLSIHFWRGRKHDRLVTERTNDEFQAAADAGRYHKSLFGGKTPEMRAMTAARSGLRNAHRIQTLPWSDEGWRILPTANYFQYTAAIREQVATFNKAVSKFVDAYPRLREEARGRLGGMYKEGDYPEVYEIAHKYGVTVQYTPLPSGSDFRVNLPEDEVRIAAEQVEERLARTVEVAMGDAWGRLLESVGRLRERLEGDGKGLREAAVRNLEEVTDVLGRLNLTDDAALESVRQQVVKELAGLDAATLREDDAARSDAAKKADEILRKMQGAYGGGGS
jgi:hypothetical protein